MKVRTSDAPEKVRAPARIAATAATASVTSVFGPSARTPVPPQQHTARRQTSGPAARPEGESSYRVAPLDQPFPTSSVAAESCRSLNVALQLSERVALSLG